MGGFWPHHLIGRVLRVGFCGQSIMLALLFAALIVSAAVVDRTLVLPGSGLGLLEHPTIWALILLQAVLPLSTHHSITRLLRARRDIERIAGAPQAAVSSFVDEVVRFVRLESWGGRGAASLLYGLGIAAFVWNSYQNQLPAGSILPFDFWDSSRHLAGYWSTRLYKLYLYGALLPYIALVHIAILTALLRLVRKARTSSTFSLIPFHQDGAGGLGFIASLISTPIIIGLLCAALPSAMAVWVHKELDLTPVLALASLLGFAITAYLIPMFVLRQDIVALKRRLISQLRARQQKEYKAISENERLDLATMTMASESLSYFDRVCSRVEAIPNFPHWKQLLRYTALTITPSALSLGLKIAETLVPRFGSGASGP